MEAAGKIAERRGLALQSHAPMDQPAVPMDERLTAYLAEAIEAAGFPGETDAQRRRPRRHGDGGAHADGDALSAQPRRHQPQPGGGGARRRCGGGAAWWAASFSSGWRPRLARIEQQNLWERGRRFASSGATRSSLKPDHLLQTPDTFIRTPLPGAEGVEFVVHAGPQLGAQFTQMTAEFAAGGTLGPAPAQRFIYVIEGELELDGGTTIVTRWCEGGFAYLPQGAPHTVARNPQARAAVIEKPYEIQAGRVRTAGRDRQ